MLVDQSVCDSRYPGNLLRASPYTNHRNNDRHNSNNNDNYKYKNVGRAVIHKYKSPHILEPTTTAVNNQSNKLKSLTHCQKCSNPFHQPITLSCGFTLCSNCLPASSQCLSFSCLRTHKNDTCKPTVLLESILSQFNPIMEADNSQLKGLLDCSICLSTLIEPITTQCGHTFCKECLIRTMTDMNTRSCPFCRTELSRIGKVNQVICGWLDYLNNNICYYQDDINSDDEEQEVMPQHIPIIQVTSAVAFPTQHCLIHIVQDNRSLLKHMITHPHKKHHAICIFSKPVSSSLSSTFPANEFFEYGIMLQINHVEHIPDVRHSVVQAIGLFRLRIKQLAVDMDDCYTGDIARLDDLVENNDDEFIIDRQLLEQTKNKIWTMPTTIITPSANATNIPKTSSHHTRKMTRPRPCSMRLSSSAPSNYQYTTVDNYGSNTRKTWTAVMHFNKPPSPPPSFNSIKKPTYSLPQNMVKISNHSRSTAITANTTTTLDNLFEQELHPYLVQYLTKSGNNVWMMQYDWYLQKSDRSSLIWWVANILPLEYNKRIHLLSMETLRERVMTLIVWADK